MVAVTSRVAVPSRVGAGVGAPWSPPRVGNHRKAVPGAVPFPRVVVGPRVRLPASTYRRRRAVAAGLVVGLVLAVWVALGMLGGGPLLVPEHPDPANRLAPGVTYVVQPGDTLWSIAARLRPDGDPRPLVDRLVAAHGGVTLYVGERIPLPGP